MKHQALFSSKDKSKKLKCRLLQFLFGPLRVKLENMFVQHYAPNHMPDIKRNGLKKKIIQNLITEYVQKLISSSTPWSVTICQISES